MVRTKKKLRVILLISLTGMLILASDKQIVAEAVKESIVLNAFDEKILVKGIVIDENNEELSGVYIKAGKQVTRSDKKGRFKIEGVPGQAVYFSLIGKSRQEMTIREAAEKMKIVMFTKDNSIKEKSESEKKEEEKTLSVIDEMPSFPGGNVQSYIARSIRYPQDAARLGIQGKVHMSFVIDKTGKVINTKVVRGLYPSLDKEAFRIISSMPDWIPGIYDGEYVNVSFTIAVKFGIKDKEYNSWENN